MSSLSKKVRVIISAVVAVVCAVIALIGYRSGAALLWQIMVGVAFIAAVIGITAYREPED